MPSDLIVQETREIQKALITAEDLCLGVGKVTQVRCDGEEELTKLNASSLQSILVVEDIQMLTNTTYNGYINPNTLGATKIAFVLSTNAFYKYNDSSSNWDALNTGTPSATTTDALTSNPNGQTASLLSQINSGGYFIYDETQKSVNNGGTIINGWVRQYTGGADIRWFGAVVDATTDNSAAIQKALNAVSHVYIPAGEFKVLSTLTMNKGNQISGDSQGKLLWDTDIKLIQLASDNVVEGFQIVGVLSSASQIGVSLIDEATERNNIKNVAIRNMVFKSVGLAGIGINGQGSGITIDGCYFDGCASGIYLYPYGANLNALRCSFYNCNVGVKVHGFNSLFSNLMFNTCATSIYLAEGTGAKSVSATSSGLEFLNCQFVNSGSYDINAQSYAVGNTLFNSCNFSGIINFYYTNGCKFFRNTFIKSQFIYNSSNYNIITKSFLNNCSFSNDQSSNTANYQYDNEYSDMQTDTVCYDGGYLKVKNASTSITIPNASLGIVTFDTILNNSLPFHYNQNKISFYDKNNNTFVLNSLTDDKKSNMVFFRAVLNGGSSSFKSQKIVLYKVNSASENISLASLDWSRVYLAAIGDNLAPSSTYFTNENFVISGWIPRGLYKLVWINNSSTAITPSLDGANLPTSSNCKVAYQAEVFGI